jgi:hypothetical protein
MSRRALLPVALTAALVSALALSAAAQAPNFAGTWKLDAAASKVAPLAGLGGLIPNGAPAVLHVTQPANGTLVIESQINEGHARIYKPNAKTATPVGQGGTITMLTKWSGRTIVSEGAAQAPNGNTSAVKETFTLSADGRTLSVDVVTTVEGQTHTSAMTYTRIQSVGPCESWPTPCKRPGQ